MFFKIKSAFDCLAIRLDKIDVVKMEYNSDDLSDKARHTLQMYQADQDAPVAEYDITKLTIDQRHELFDAITNALQIEVFSDSDAGKLVYNIT